MKHKIIKLLAGCALSMIVTASACAGGINSAEQKVIDTVSQSFSYNGKTYVVKDSYIAAGKNKMAGDDINLSQSDASAYTAQFNASHAELVEEGYCDEIGGGSSDNNSDKNPSETNPPKTSKQNKEFLKLIFGKPDKDEEKNPDESSKPGETKNPKPGEGSNAADGNSASGNDAASDGNGTSGGQESDGSSESNSKNENDAWQENVLGTVFEFDEDDIGNAKEKNAILTYKDKEYNLSLSEKQSEEKSESALDRLLCTNVSVPLIYAITGFSVLTLVILILYICFKEKHTSHGTLIFLKSIGIISIAGSLLAVFIVLTVYFSIYNKSSLRRQMMESDYFSGVTQMVQELEKEALIDAGYSEDIADEVFAMSNVYIVEKQYIDDVLSGNKETSVQTEKIHELLLSKINQKGNDEDTLLIEKLEKIYTDTLEFDMGKVLSDTRKNFVIYFASMVIILAALILCIFLTLQRIQKSLDGGIKSVAAGMGIASLVTVAAALLLKFRDISGAITVDPVYYEQFIKGYVDNAVNVMIYIGCMGILAAVALFFLQKYVKENYDGRVL